MTSQSAEFPSARIPLCVLCQRLRRPVKGRWSCVAFPNGIPSAFLEGKSDHREPVPGDRGIRFEPDWGAPARMLALASSRR